MPPSGTYNSFSPNLVLAVKGFGKQAFQGFAGVWMGFVRFGPKQLGAQTVLVGNTIGASGKVSKMASDYEGE